MWPARGGPAVADGTVYFAASIWPFMGVFIHALDARTGKELWSSGDQITSWNHFSGLTVANGRAYVATFDGTLYCFGIPR